MQHILRPQYGLIEPPSPVRSGERARYGHSQRPPAKSQGNTVAGQTPTHTPHKASSSWQRVQQHTFLIATDSGWHAALKPLTVATRAVSDAALYAELSHSGLVVVERSDAAAVKFWQEGDVSLSTSDVMKQRLALRHDAGVIQCLVAWWETIMHSTGMDESASPDGRGSLRRADHAIVMRVLYKALLDDFDPDSQEAQNDIDGEWVRDSRGRAVMGRDDLYDSLFELADMWTAGVTALEYIDFLWRLLQHVTKPTGGFKSLSAIACFSPKQPTRKASTKEAEAARRIQRARRAHEERRKMLDRHSRKELEARRVSERRAALHAAKARQQQAAAKL